MNNTPVAHDEEVESGERFEFGRNWLSFLEHINEERVEIAVSDLKRNLQRDSLEGLTFLDVGSGSGLSSLAARRLGAKVVSFDFDPSSVACTLELRNRFFAGDESWTIESGSALDSEYMKQLGEFDIVYSWGVLHHTGDMWKAITNAISQVKDSGVFYLAIYNDQGGASNRWRILKKLYNQLPAPANITLAVLVSIPLSLRSILVGVVRGDPLMFFRYVKNYKHMSARGMSYWHDVIDWIGGYPFEVAKPEEIFSYCKDYGFVMDQMTTCGGGSGCNVFVFSRQG